MAARKSSAKAKALKVDLHALGARVVSVFGPFNSRVLIELPETVAAELFPAGSLGTSGRSNVIEAVERDLADLRTRAPELADSALAASALALAYELEHPYNSATSKSMCARTLHDALRELRELAPAKQEKDFIDDLADDLATARARRAGGGAGATAS